jgi:hypothetical protein
MHVHTVQVARVSMVPSVRARAAIVPSLLVPDRSCGLSPVATAQVDSTSLKPAMSTSVLGSPVRLPLAPPPAAPSERCPASGRLGASAGAAAHCEGKAPLLPATGGSLGAADPAAAAAACAAAQQMKIMPWASTLWLPC